MAPDELFFAAFSAITGLLVAIGIFLVANRLVIGARVGNRLTREARHDPHIGRVPGTTRGERRDIGQ